MCIKRREKDGEKGEELQARERMIETNRSSGSNIEMASFAGNPLKMKRRFISVAQQSSRRAL